MRTTCVVVESYTVGVLFGVATTQVRMCNSGRAVRLEYRRACDLARDDAGWKRWGNDA